MQTKYLLVFGAGTAVGARLQAKSKPKPADPRQNSKAFLLLHLVFVRHIVSVVKNNGALLSLFISLFFSYAFGV